jgi:nickel-dependent lactate racemase
MPTVAVPWGDSELEIALPENWRLQQVAGPQLRAAPRDWQDSLARALERPGAGVPLSRLLGAARHGRIAVIVEDLTRPSPLPEILGVLFREIRHGRSGTGNVEIVFATGMHPPLTADQAAGKLGPLAGQVPWRCNPWQDPSKYVRVGKVDRLEVEIDRGVTEADVRIIVSSVSPHLQAGFGGGYKMLLPGCASLETIRGLHRLGVGRRARQLVGTDAEANPMRQAVDAGGQLIDGLHGTSFAAQYVLDDGDRPAYISAGEVLPAQRMLAKQCAVACGVIVPEPADVLITNAHPRDFDLWQSFKSVANTLWAARPGGVILCLSRCEAGMEGIRPPRWPLNAAWTRRLVRLLGPDGLSSLLMRLIPRLAGDAAFFVRMALQALHRNPILFASPTLFQAGRFPGVEVFPDADGAVAAARRLLGDAPQRAVVFPAGGITFPVPGSPFPGGQAR